MLQDNPQSAAQVAKTQPFDEYDRPTIALPPPASARGHTRSRTTVDLPPLFARTPSSSPSRASGFLPFLRPASQRSISPERVSVREAAEYDVESASSTGTVNQQKQTGAVGKLASWFEGSSDPVNISLVPSPRKEMSDPLDQSEDTEKIFSASSGSVDTLTRRPQRTTQRTSMSTPTNPGSRFSFFRRGSQALPKREADREDDLSQLDISETLFPHGLPDEFSPAAFKNLQLNAEGALRQFQTAHIEQRKSIRTITSTKNIQADELEASRTRNEHLKLQLMDMAEKATEQEKTITALRAELAGQPAFQASNEGQYQSIRMVSHESASANQDTISRQRSRYRRKRSSDISTSGESEVGSEFSSVVSVFSEAMSVTDSPGTSVAASPVMKHATMRYPHLQHCLPGDSHSAVIPVFDCQKCHGVRSSEAWDVVSMMRAESTALKERIAELEAAQRDALDLILDGIKLT